MTTIFGRSVRLHGPEGIKAFTGASAVFLRIENRKRRFFDRSCFVANRYLQNPVPSTKRITCQTLYLCGLAGLAGYPGYVG